MIEGYEDWFVGSVAIGWAPCCWRARCANSDSFYSLRSSRWLVALVARTGSTSRACARWAAP